MPNASLNAHNAIAMQNHFPNSSFSLALASCCRFILSSAALAMISLRLNGSVGAAAELSPPSVYSPPETLRQSQQVYEQSNMTRQRELW